MILLELTEIEVDFLKEVIELEKVSVAASNVEYAEKERKTGICNTFLKKITLACKPKSDILITYQDLFCMISDAKQEYTQLPLDLHISDKEVQQNYYVHIAVANVMIMWLNSKRLLKGLARFDYTDQSSAFENLEDI